MPDPNAGWLDQPYPGSPTQTNRDAITAVQMMKAGLLQPQPVVRLRGLVDPRRARAHQLGWALVWAVLAVLFFVGTVMDLGSKHLSYKPSLVIACVFSGLALVQVVRAAFIRR